MRLTEAEREVFYERLKVGAAEGGLSIEELERRVEAVARAETREEAETALSDLPVPPPPGAAPGPGTPAPARAGWGRGHAEAERPGGDWSPTAERFRDPRSGQVMRVWEDRAGQRHYVPED